jgi:TIR domain
MEPIFLCYAREDKPKVDEIYRRLRAVGLDPWMDIPPQGYELSGVLPGEDWEAIIRRRLRSAPVVLAFLSPVSVSKKGYVQREVKLALDLMAERPANEIWLVPVLLERCDIPDLAVGPVRLTQFQCFHLYESSIDVLIDFLQMLFGHGRSAQAHDRQVTNFQTLVKNLKWLREKIAQEVKSSNQTLNELALRHSKTVLW